MFRKVLVANRGEIATRAFRALYELGIGSVAVYPVEDRNSLHRQKADESYQIGEEGHPVRAYLDIAEIVRAAQAAGADAIYPGYGFLSENPNLAQACVDAGITFIGPPPDILEMAGNKATAVAAAREAGIPVLESSPPSADVERADRRRGDRRLPDLRQSGRRRRRTRHAPGGDGPRTCATRCRRRCVRPNPRSATRRSSWRPRSSNRGTSRYRYWPMRPATSCTSTSATARYSADTRR